MREIERGAKKALHELLKRFPCVAVIGARQTGKTTLLKQVWPDAPLFDMERRADRERVQRDPEFFLSQFDGPLAIDEAQSLPELFPALRVAIDNSRAENGRYLISGSSSPHLLRNITESLAGRVAFFELGGFSLDEQWGVHKNPFYSTVVSGRQTEFLDIPVLLTRHQLFHSFLRGGYPEPSLKFKNDLDGHSFWMENYFQAYIQRDIRSLFPRCRIQAYQRLISMLAGTSGQILNLQEFARSLEVSHPVVRNYLDIAHGTFVWRFLPAFTKNVKKRVSKSPRGQMRDSGLLNHLLNIRTADGLQNHALVGRHWETFISEQIIKGFNDRLVPVTPFYYRTSNGAEIDLILEGSFGLLPIEIKMGASLSPRDLTSLETFVKERRLPFGLVINNAPAPARLTPSLFQIPAGCL